MSLTALIPFTEHWATIYKPMLHERKKNKRFFCIESIASLANLAKELPKADSPIVCIETNIGGGISRKFIMPEYNVYFFVCANQKLQDNDIADSAAKEEALQHAISFLNYLRHEQELHRDDRRFQLLALDMDNIRFETFGPMFNRWFCVGISMMDLSAYNRCFNPDEYEQIPE